MFECGVTVEVYSYETKKSKYLFLRCICYFVFDFKC